MLGSGVVNLLVSQDVHLPKTVEVLAQVALGIVVGFSFNRSLLTSALPILMWAVLGALSYLLLGLLLAFVASRLGFLDFDTALFGFSPGGFTGMSILAGAEGANAAVVALIHFTRVILLFIIVPTLVRFLTRS